MTDGLSGHRWEAYSHQELWDFAHSGGGPEASRFAELNWGEAWTVIRGIDLRLSTAIGAAGAGWEGQAATAATSAVTPLGVWATGAVERSWQLRQVLGAQSTDAEHVRAQMPPVGHAALPEQPPGPRGVPRYPGPTAFTDWSVADAERTEQAQRARDLMRQYSDRSIDSIPPLPPWESPPAVVLASTAEAPGGPATTGGGGAGGGTGQLGPSERVAAGGTGGSGSDLTTATTAGPAGSGSASPGGTGPGGIGSGGAGSGGTGTGGAGSGGIGPGSSGGIGSGGIGPGGSTGAGPAGVVPIGPGTAGSRTTGGPRPGGAPTRDSRYPSRIVPGAPGSGVPGSGPLTPGPGASTRDLPGRAGAGGPGAGGVGGEGRWRGGSFVGGDPLPPPARGSTGSPERPFPSVGGTEPRAARPVTHPGMLPFGGAGAGAGEQEHARPSYLVDDSGAFTDDRWVCPAVIGGDDPEPGRA